MELLHQAAVSFMMFLIAIFSKLQMKWKSIKSYYSLTYDKKYTCKIYDELGNWVHTHAFDCPQTYARPALPESVNSPLYILHTRDSPHILISTRHDFTDVLHCRECTYRFIDLTCSIENEEYTIRLIDEMFNYYVEGNVIDHLFIRYYMNAHYGVRNVDQYTLTLLDADMNCITCTPEDEIILTRSNYKKK